MGFDFRFREVGGIKDIKMLVDFLMKQTLGYPHYEDWVQRVEHDVDVGYKKTVLAFSGSNLVGDCIYQSHKELPRVREIKNVRVHPGVRGRYFGAFMLKQAEAEKKEEYDLIICDARPDRHDMANIFTMMGYTPLMSISLYDKNVTDVVYVKTFNKRTEQGILYNTKEFISKKGI